MRKLARFVAGSVVLTPFLYVASCSIISHVHEHEFAQVKEGDVEAQVVTTMGEPSDEERAGGDMFLDTVLSNARRRAPKGCGISIASASLVSIGWRLSKDFGTFGVEADWGHGDGDKDQLVSAHGCAPPFIVGSFEPPGYAQ
jgi:hypothetical protein